MGIIENASVTLEKIVEADGRVPSSLIKAEFDKIMTTGVIPTHRELYSVIKANTGYSFGTTRKIIEGVSKTGPKILLGFLKGLVQSEYFEQLKQKSDNDKQTLSSLSMLVNQIMITHPLANQLAFTYFLLMQLRHKHPELKRDTLRKSLFHKPNEMVQPWHYSAYKILKQTLDGNITVPNRYLRIDVKTYQRLLRFAYDSLRARGISKKEYIKLIGTALDISPKTIIAHMYRKSPQKSIVKGHTSKSRDYFSRLVEYISKEILITVNVADTKKPEEGLEKIEEQVYLHQTRNQILIITDKTCPNYVLAKILTWALPYLKERTYQIALTFDSIHTPQAILSLKLPNSKFTPYTAFPANRS